MSSRMRSRSCAILVAWTYTKVSSRCTASKCAVREIREETSLRVELVDIIGVYTDPDIRIAYSDGEVRQEFTVVYLGESAEAEVTIDEESTDFRWLPLREVGDVPMAASQRRRMRDVVAHLEHTGQGDS